MRYCLLKKKKFVFLRKFKISSLIQILKFKFKVKKMKFSGEKSLCHGRDELFSSQAVKVVQFRRHLRGRTYSLPEVHRQ